jgi:hypothetical protein
MGDPACDDYGKQIPGRQCYLPMLRGGTTPGHLSSLIQDGRKRF